MGGGGSRTLGRYLIDRFGPGVGHLNYLAVPEVGVFEVLFMPVTTNHLPGWGIPVIFDLTFLPRGSAFDSNFLEMSNPCPMPCFPLPPPLPTGLYGTFFPPWAKLVHTVRAIEYQSVTSQKNKFAKLWDLVPFSSKASLEKGPCQKLPLNCISQLKYKG